MTNPGYQDYVPGPKADYTTGTVGHNSLLVNGQGQINLGGGGLREELLLPSFEAVVGDAAESYGGLLKRYRRSVLHIDSAYYFIVDDVELHQESDEAELLFHTTSAVLDGEEPKAPGEILGSESVVFQGESAALQLMFPFPKEKVLTLREYPGAETYGPYVAVGGTKGKRRRFITLINPRVHYGERLAILQEEQDTGSLASGLTVERPGGAEDIWLFCADAVEARYRGITFLGEAARLSGNGMLNLWKAERLSGGDIAFEAELPLSLYSDDRRLTCIVHNPTLWRSPSS